MTLDNPKHEELTMATGKGVALRNPKRERFCREYVIDANAQHAAIRAGYSARTSEQIGYRLLQNASVATRIAGPQAKIAERLEITADASLRESFRPSYLGAGSSLLIGASSLAARWSRFQQTDPGAVSDLGSGSGCTY